MTCYSEGNLTICVADEDKSVPRRRVPITPAGTGRCACGRFISVNELELFYDSNPYYGWSWGNRYGDCSRCGHVVAAETFFELEDDE